MDYSFKKKKTFKPLILYNCSSSKDTDISRNDSQLEQKLIEEHIVKTRDMLDHNAQMWENEGHVFDTSAASPIEMSLLDESPQQLISAFNTPKNISNHSNRSSISFIGSPTNDNQFISDRPRRESSAIIPNTDTSGINLLEPQTQTTIPLLLYNKEVNILDNDLVVSPPLSLPDSRRSSTHFTFTKSEEEEEEEETYFYEEEIPTNNTVTFITEPQFHLTYKPQIARKRRRGNLPKQVTEFLRRWLILHKKHPYPTEREKQKLADETGLMVSQISNWFINARRRILQPLLESETRQSGEISTSRPTGVNVVGGTNNMNNRINISESSNYQPHHHHNYNYNSSNRASNLLLHQPTQDNTASEEGDTVYEVPPPWVLLPTKLPAMNILEKDLDAFEPEQ